MLPASASTTTISISRDSIDQRRSLLGDVSENVPMMLSEKQVKNKIENYVGCIPYPLGLIGPLTIKGKHANGEFVVPMATLEGTLLASYSRGCKLMVESARQLNLPAACETWCSSTSMTRMVCFSCSCLGDSEKLSDWVSNHEADIKKIVEETDKFIELQAISCEHLACTLGIKLTFSTGDAMGSNMSSHAAMAVGKFVEENSGVKIEVMPGPFPEDKKNTPLSRKGKKVVAHTVLTADVLEKSGRTSIAKFHEFTVHYANMLCLQGGCSTNIHAINGLAALYVAFGQDLAYLGECSQSIIVSTHPRPSGKEMDVSVTIPSLIIGTVGGGTGLPAFTGLLKFIGCQGLHTAERLAEIMAAIVLAGEISCGVAHCADEFVMAHDKMGRNDPTLVPQQTDKKEC